MRTSRITKPASPRIRDARRRPLLAITAALLALASAGRAQQLPDRPADAGAQAAASMPALLGPYDMTREGSGTSWQPESSPMQGVHMMQGAWMSMIHGFADGIYDDQGGPRGADKSFSTSMLMWMARRDLEAGALGVRLMASADPLMGRDGYPLLFQTGETANGRDPLIDRQHPHDLLMEAAASYSLNLSPGTALFAYAGLPGEPALGPEAFMHRLSAMDNPQAPLGHHWLDSSHIAWGVVTGGYAFHELKIEASAFNGREPDENRYNIEVRPLDSYAARLTYNPTRDWSLQGSFGRLASPEQLEPGVSVRRTTASASYNAPLALWWQTTFAWGRNEPSRGAASNAWLLESASEVARDHTLFARFERVAKDELFLPGAALEGRTFTISALTFGYIRDLAHVQALKLGVGALVSTYSYSAVLNPAYGQRPVSFMVFVRARL